MISLGHHFFISWITKNIVAEKSGRSVGHTKNKMLYESRVGRVEIKKFSTTHEFLGIVSLMFIRLF